MGTLAERRRVLLRVGLVLAIIVVAVCAMLLGAVAAHERFAATLRTDNGPIELELIDTDLSLGVGAADGPALVAHGVVGRGDLVRTGERTLKVICASGVRCAVVLEVAAGAVLPSVVLTSYQAVRTTSGSECAFPFESGGDTLYACTSSGRGAPYCRTARGELEACEATPPFLDGAEAFLAHSPFARDLGVRSVRNTPEDGSAGSMPLRIDGSLTIRGGGVDVRLHDLRVSGRVSVSVHQGVLDLRGLDAPEADLRTGRLETLEGGCQRWGGGGDVLVTTASRPATLRYEAAAHSCLAARSVGEAEAEACVRLPPCDDAAANTTDTGGGEAANATAPASVAIAETVCYGAVALCTGADAGAGGACGQRGEMALSVAQGNGGMQVTAGERLSASSEMATRSLGSGDGGGGGGGGARLDRAARLAMREMRGWIDEYPTTPAFLTVRLDGPAQRSLGYFYFSTSAPYAVLEPHWLSTFTGSLLQPRARFLAARAAAPTCPYTPLHPVGTQLAVAQVSHALRVALGVRPSERLLLSALAGNSTLLGRGAAGGGASPLPPLGAWTRRAKYEYTLISASEWTFRPLTLGVHGRSILLSVLCSLTIAALLALGSCHAMHAGRARHKEAFWRRVAELERLKATEAATVSNADAAPASSALAAARARPTNKQADRQEPALPPLMLIEQLLDRVWRHSCVDSLQHFLQLAIEMDGERAPSQPAPAEGEAGVGPERGKTDAEGGLSGLPDAPRERWVELRALQEAYEGFCHAHHFTPADLRDTKPLADTAAFRRFGCRVRHVSDPSTNAYRGILLVTRSRIDESARPLPEEDSLRFFLRTGCRFTGKRVDILRSAELGEAYDRFCLRHKGLDKVPATRRVIVAAGASFDRLTLSYVVPRAGERLNLRSPRLSRDNVPPTPKLWWLMDLALVCAHLLLVVGAPLPLLAVAAYTEGLAALFLPSPSASVAGPRSDARPPSLRTWLLEPWLLPAALGAVGPVSALLLLVGALTVAVGLVELVWYYCTRDLLGQPVEALRSHPPSAARSRLQQLLLLLWALQLCGCIGYAALMLVWVVLGAMVAPEVVLPYAAGAATFVTLALAKWRELSSLKRGLEESIRARMRHQLHAALERSLRLAHEMEARVAAQHGALMRGVEEAPLGNAAGKDAADSAAGAAAAAGARSSDEGASVGVGGSGPLGGGDAGGAQRNSLLSYAAGKPDALFLVSAANMGLEPTVARAVLASAKRDAPGLRAAARELAALPAIGLDPELAECVLDLFATDRPSTQRNALRKVATAFVALRMRSLEPAAAAALRRLLTPALFEAIASLGADRPQALIGICRAKGLLPAEVQLGAELVSAVLAEDEAETAASLGQIAELRVGLPCDIARGLLFILDGTPTWPMPPDVEKFVVQALRLHPAALLLVLAKRQRWPMMRHAVQELSEMLRTSAPEHALQPALLHALVTLVHGTEPDERSLARLYIFDSIPPAAARAVYGMSAGKLSDEGAEWLGSRIDGLNRLEIRALFELAQHKVQVVSGRTLGPALERVLDTFLALADLPEEKRPRVRALLTLYAGSSAEQVAGACAELTLEQPLPRLICLARGLLSPSEVVTKELRDALVEYCRPERAGRDAAADGNSRGGGKGSSKVTLAWLDKHELTTTAAASHEADSASAKAAWLSKLGLALLREGSVPVGRRGELYGALALHRHEGSFANSLLDQKLGATPAQAHLLRALCKLPFLAALKPQQREPAVSTVGKVLQVGDTATLGAFLDAAAAGAAYSSEGGPAGYEASVDTLLKRLDVADPDVQRLHRYVADIRRDTDALERAKEPMRLLCARTGVPDFFVRRLLASGRGEPAASSEMHSLVVQLQRSAAESAKARGASGAPPAEGSVPLAPVRAAPQSAQAVSQAVDAMLAGSVERVGALDGVLGVPSGECELLFSLLGRARNAPQLVRSLPTVLERVCASAPPHALLPRSARAQEALCALGAFVAGHDLPLPVAGGQRPSQVLAELCRVPPAVLVGLLATLRRDRAGCREALRKLAPTFEVHAVVLDGMLSLSTGEIEHVELLAETVGFDADLAEALAVSSGRFAPGKGDGQSMAAELCATQTLGSLATSGSLQRLCGRAGLPHSKVAALLAIACGDYASADKCIGALGLRMHAPYLRAICAVGLCARTLPADALKLLMTECAPLFRLFGMKRSPGKGALVVCLAQGNVAAAIVSLQSMMRWSARDAAAAAAVCLLSHPLSVLFSPMRADDGDWLEQRNGLIAADVLANALGAPSPAVRLLVGASRKDAQSLEALGGLLGLTRHDMWRAIMQLAGAEADGADSESLFVSGGKADGESDSNSEAALENAPVHSDALSEASVESEDLSAIAAALEKAFPADEYPQGDGASSVALSAGAVGALLTLPCGCASAEHAHELVRAMQREAGTLLSANTVGTLSALVARNARALERLERERWSLQARSSSVDDAQRTAMRIELGHTLLGVLGWRFDEEEDEGDTFTQRSLRLVLGLASADGGGWEPLGGQAASSPAAAALGAAAAKPISAQVHSSPRVLRALTALAHVNGDLLATEVLGEGGLAELTRMPKQALRSVLAICVPSRSSVDFAVSRLALAMGERAAHVMAFAAGSSRDDAQQASMLRALFQATGLDEALGIAIFRAMRFSERAWVQLGHAAIEKELGPSASTSRIGIDAANLLALLADLAAGRTRLARADVELLARAVGVAEQGDDASRLEATLAQSMGARRHKREFQELLSCVLHLAANRIDGLDYLMRRVLALPQEGARRRLLRPVLSAFRRSHDLERALPIVDRALASAGLLPHGAVRLIFGACNCLFYLAAEGVEDLNRAGALVAGEHGRAEAEEGAPGYILGAASLLVAVSRRSVLEGKAWERHAAALQQLVQRFDSTGATPSAELCRNLLAIVSYDAVCFGPALAHISGQDVALIDELYAVTDANSRAESAPFLRALILEHLSAAMAGRGGDPMPDELGGNPLARVQPLGGSVGELMQFVTCFMRMQLPIKLTSPTAGQLEPAVQDMLDALRLPEDQLALLRALYLTGVEPTNMEPILASVPTLLQLAANAQAERSRAKVPPEELEQASALLCASMQLIFSLKALDGFSGDGAQSPIGMRVPDAALGRMAESFGVQPELVLGFAALAAGDLDGMKDLASTVCEFDAVRVRALLDAIELERSKANAAGASSQVLDSANRRGKTRLDTPREIFAYFDADRSGKMDIEEFEEVIQNMGVYMSRQRAMQIFSRASADGGAVINVDEFEKAYERLQDELAVQTLRDISLSGAAIAASLAGLLGFVSLVFVFIFFGVSAFSGSSSFEGVVNSAMPLATGALAMNQSKVDPQEKLEKASRAVDAILDRQLA